MLYIHPLLKSLYYKNEICTSCTYDTVVNTFYTNCTGFKKEYIVNCTPYVAATTAAASAAWMDTFDHIEDVDAAIGALWSTKKEGASVTII